MEGAPRRYKALCLRLLSERRRTPESGVGGRASFGWVAVGRVGPHRLIESISEALKQNGSV